MITEQQQLRGTDVGPGVYRDMPSDVYHSMWYASKTYLHAIHSRNPKHCRWLMDNFEETPALRIGDAFHCLTLESQKVFDSRFVVAEQCSARNKAGGHRCNNPGKVLLTSGEWMCGVHARSDRYADLLRSTIDRYLSQGFVVEKVSDFDSHYLAHDDGRLLRVSNHQANAASRQRMLREGREDIRVDLPPFGNDDARTILSADEFKQICRMRQAVNEHQYAAKLLAARSGTEVSYVWDDPQTGIRSKGRVDITTTFGILTDLKSTGDASPDAFRRDMRVYGYDIQSAQYLDGVPLCESVDYGEFAFICCEKEEPHGVAVYVIDDDSVDVGRAKVRDTLPIWHRCITSGQWPGYPDSHAMLVSLPEFEKQRYLDQQLTHREWQ